jgi:hypothetical protein
LFYYLKENELLKIKETAKQTRTKKVKRPVKKLKRTNKVSKK